MYRAVFSKKNTNTLGQIKATAQRQGFKFKTLRAIERDGLYIIEFETDSPDGDKFMTGYIRAYPGCSGVYKVGQGPRY